MKYITESIRSLPRRIFISFLYVREFHYMIYVNVFVNWFDIESTNFRELLLLFFASFN